jgi:hypothetical protein
MGNPLACESFKKLQSAYEVLSDFTKKNTYDDQLRKEESRKMTQRSRVVSQQTGVEFLSEESRRIQCTKCGNFHLWICTKKSKAKARWCQVWRPEFFFQVLLIESVLTANFVGTMYCRIALIFIQLRMEMDGWKINFRHPSR